MNCVIKALCQIFHCDSSTIAPWFDNPENGVHQQQVIEFVLQYSALKPVTYYLKYDVDDDKEYTTNLSRALEVLKGRKALLLGVSTTGVYHCYMWDGTLVDGTNQLEEIYPLLHQAIILI